MWTPEILKTEDDPTLIWIAAPFEMARITPAIVGRTMMMDGAAHLITGVVVDSGSAPTPITPGERLCLRVRRLDSTGDQPLGAFAP